MSRFVLTACLAALVALVYVYYTGHQTRGASFPIRLNDTYDYIIVGAGSAGSVLASRLSEDLTRDILLLEAGGSEEDHPSIRVPGEAGQIVESEQDWMYFTEPQIDACLAMKEQRSYWARGKVLGGSSTLNYLQFVRGNRHDYDSWAEEGCEGWSYKDVLPYFIKSEDIHIDEFKNSGFCWTQANLKNGERWSSYRSFVEPHTGRSNLHISPNTVTTKIIIMNKKAVGVECIRNGRKVRLYARKEVILSAGTINSPHLLMLSGVGPNEHLLKYGVAEKVFTAREDIESITIFPVLLHPKSRGTIRLKSTDPFEYPEIDPHFLQHPDDVKMAIKMIRFVERLVDTNTMLAIGMDVNGVSPLHQLCVQHEFRSDEFWECYVRHYTINLSHATSTCRMGAVNDQSAVLDPLLRVKGISGLRVVDASVMRNLPGGNTHAPVTMIAEKAADIIRQS